MGYFSDLDAQMQSDEFCYEYEEWVEILDEEMIAHMEEDFK